MLIVRAGCSGRHSREGSPCGVILRLARMRNHLRPLSALSFATGQVFTAPLPAKSGRLTWPIFLSRGKSAHRKRKRNKMQGRTRRGKHASLRAGSSPFVSCSGLPAPCSRRIKVKQAADKKILIKKPPTAKKCETSCAGGRPFFLPLYFIRSG